MWFYRAIDEYGCYMAEAYRKEDLIAKCIEEVGYKMNTIPLLIILGIMLAYFDFSIWYSAEMHNIWNDEKRKFRGIFFKFWDWIGK